MDEDWQRKVREMETDARNERALQQERNAKMADEIVCIRALLGLTSPLQSTMQAVRVLFENGRGEFERIRDLGVLAKSTEKV